MGILQCAVAKALGAAQIVVVDIDVHRVTFACNEAFATSGHGDRSSVAENVPAGN